MKLLSSQPETPIQEELLWQTNVQTSFGGTEVRVCLSDEPKRTLSLRYVFGSEDEIREARAIAIAAFDRPFLLPCWHQATRLTAKTVAAGKNVSLAPARTELRPLGRAILFDGRGALEVITINAVGAAGATLAAPLARVWPKGTMIAPLVPVYAGANPSIARYPKGGGNMSISAGDVDFGVPFVNPANREALPMFDGLPVVEQNAIGDNFDEGFSNNTAVTEYIGRPNIKPTWTHQQMTYARTFLCNRTFDRASWQRWNKLFDYAKGSHQPFYLPTFREDFEVISAPVPGGNVMTLKGVDYAESFFPFEAFKQFAFLSSAGMHYAKVTACVAENGNSKVAFAPALPSDAKWADEQIVSLLMRVRIADDRVTCEHTVLQTRITLNLRTTDN